MNSSMTLGGWLFLIGAWSAIICLNVFCFFHILREKEEEIAEPVAELEKAEESAEQKSPRSYH